MHNNKTSSLTEAAMICGILVVMSMVSYYILPFIDFLFPLPAIILAKRRGCKYSALALVSASIITMMLLGFPIGLMYLFMYTPIGIAMSYLIAKDKNPSGVILLGGVVALVALIVVLYVAGMISGIEISAQIESMIGETFEIQKNIMNSTGMDETQQKLITDMYENLADYIIMLLPIALMAFSLGITYINYFVVQKFALRFKIVIKPLKDFSLFCLPKNFILGICFLMVLTYILNMMRFSNMDIILINIVMIGRFALIAQGLALAKFYMLRGNVNGFLRLIVFIIILFVPIASNIVTIVGVVDLIVDFRKLKIKK